MQKILIATIYMVTTIISIAIIISLVNFWNSRSSATAMVEQELSQILKLGTKKENVINFLVRTGRPAIDATTHFLNGECATARVGEFRWNCEYASYVSTGWHIEMFSIARPHIQVFFVFNEKNELAKSYSHVSYTFL
jgi:hypothetical protein